SNFTRIDVNTPMFWSVGAGNAQLRPWEHRSYEPDESNLKGPEYGDRQTMIQESVYVLVPQEEEMLGEPPFVFALPK
ncbi:MAG TPA: hypothetical protein VJ809_09845, partial [Pirellulales bacterium]|nr:hypothetical protein [Pirellulales bacterium]